MYSWVHPNLEIRPNEKLGAEGVFTNAPLPQGERLVVFGGHVMTLTEEEGLPEGISDLAHQIDDDLVMGVKRPEHISLSDKLNHSCEPNSGFKGQTILIAMRSIAANEEITFDYATTLGGESSYEMACQCGAQNCRKFVTSSDWKIPELQEKYRGYFQYYLEQKIKEQNNTL